MLTALQTRSSQCLTPHVTWTSQTRIGGQRGPQPANPRGKNVLPIMLRDLLKGLSLKMGLFYLHTLSRGAVWQAMSIIQGSLHQFYLSFNTLYGKLTVLYLRWGVHIHTWVSTQGRVKMYRIILNSWWGQRAVQLRIICPTSTTLPFSCWTPVALWAQQFPKGAPVSALHLSATPRHAPSLDLKTVRNRNLVHP